MRKLYVSRLRGVFNFSQVILMLVALIFMSACSSQTNDSKMTLNFPDWNQTRSKAVARQSSRANLASSTVDQTSIDIIAINISGAGFSTITYSWRHKDGSSETAPTSFEFTLPRGSKPLVQVLAVYDGNNKTEFLYGDANPDTSTATAQASVTLQLKNTTANVEGQIIGRYLDQSGTGPTAKFEYLFDPDQAAGGVPEMVVTTGEVFAGWISAFTMNSPLIRYRLVGSSSSFDLSDNAQLFDNGGLTRAAQIVIPKSYRDHDGNGSDIEEEPLRYLNLGYFGPGAGTRRLCLNATSSSIPNLYNSATTRDSSTQFTWTGKTTPTDTTKSVWVNEPDSGYYGKGGDDASSCSSSGSAFSDFMKLDEAKFANGDEVLNFRAPFRGDWSLRSYDSTSKTLTVAFLPLPDTTAELGGYTIFYRKVTSSWEASNDDGIRSNDGYACDKFSNPSAFSPSFSQIQAVDAATLTSTSGSFGNLISDIQDAATAELIQVVACPYSKNGEYFDSGLMLRGSGGTSSTAATQLKAYTIDGVAVTSAAKAKIQDHMCSPIIIRSVDANGNTVWLQNPISVQVTPSRSGIESLYSSEGCQSTYSNDTITNFYGEQVVFVQSYGAAGDTASYAISDTSGSISSTSFDFDVVAYGSAIKLLTIAPTSIYKYSCQHIRFVGIASSGAPTDTANFVFSPKVLNGLTFHDASDWTCNTTDLTSSTFSFYGSGSSVASKSFFVKYSDSAATVDLSPTLASGTPAPTISATTTSILNPGNASKLAVNMSPSMTVGSCQQVRVGAVDSNSHSSPVTNAITVTLAMTNGVLYSDSYCSSVASASQTLAAGQTFVSSSLYFAPSATGTASLTASASGFTAGTVSTTVY